MGLRFVDFKAAIFISAIAFVKAIAYTENSNISDIPTEAIKGDTVLVIEHNRISRIPRDAFITYSNLRILKLHHLNLRYIEEGAFNGQDKLEYFSCKGNNILQLPSDFGPPTTSLEYINWWYSLPSGTVLTFPYFAAFRNLTELNIGGNYLSTFIPNLMPQSLLYIHLGYSRLPALPNFATYAPMLLSIYVYKCRMHSMLIENVTGLTKVRKLRLNSNVLTSIPNISFMGRLEELSVQDNHLSTVPDLFELPLTQLYLVDNPLVCDKALCWIRMWPWMKTSPIPSDEPVCARPAEVSGVKLMDVDPTFLECYRGNLNTHIILFLCISPGAETGIFRGN